MIHNLKCHPEPFEALKSGKKLFEFRKNDRGFEVGDVLRLFKWDPDRELFRAEPELRFEVTYIARGPAFGIPEGYVIMSVKRERDLRDIVEEAWGFLP